MSTVIQFDSDAGSLFEEPNMTGSPERRLLLAILERAILDYVGNDSREVLESGDWLFGETPSAASAAFSFPWVCEQLDLDPQTISTRIHKMPKRGSHRIAPWYLTKNYSTKTAEGTTAEVKPFLRKVG